MAASAVVPSATLSELAEAVFMLDGQPFSTSQYGYMEGPLNDGHPDQLMVMGRQVGKSVILAVKQLLMAATRPHTGLLHVSPAEKNLYQFINDRVDPFLSSPNFRKLFVTKGAKSNMSAKNIGSSTINYRAVHDDAERVRGITAGVVTVDEMQSIATDKLQIIQAVMTRPKFKMQIRAGTQSTRDASVNYYWEKSDMKELAIKCSGCSKWNTLGEKNIGKHFLICSGCGKQINAGRDPWAWIPMSSNSAISGYRMPSIGVPDIDWTMIMGWYEQFTQRNFYCEVLGLPFDSGSKPITEEKMRRACHEPDGPHPEMSTWWDPKKIKGRRTFAGIDWGANLGSTTQIVVWVEYEHSKYFCCYAKKFTGYESDPQVQQKIIADVIERYECMYICADWGGQYEANKKLQQKFGMNRYHEVMLNGGQREMMKFNAESQFWTCSKEQSLADLFLMITQCKITYPQWEVTRPFAQEILNEFMEYNPHRLIMEYDHPVDKPDDFLFSCLFASLAVGLSNGKFKPAVKRVIY